MVPRGEPTGDVLGELNGECLGDGAGEVLGEPRGELNGERRRVGGNLNVLLFLSGKGGGSLSESIMGVWGGEVGDRRLWFCACGTYDIDDAAFSLLIVVGS